jgi:hypothetical protein
LVKKSLWVKIGPAPRAYIQVNDFRALLFENSPLYFQRQGENFTKRKKEKDQQML